MNEGLNKKDDVKIEDYVKIEEKGGILKNRAAISQFLNISEEEIQNSKEFYKKGYLKKSGDSSFAYERDLRETWNFFIKWEKDIERERFGLGEVLSERLRKTLEVNREWARSFRNAEIFLRALEEIDPNEFKKMSNKSDILYSEICLEFFKQN
jgi:hypothetical protein